MGEKGLNEQEHEKVEASLTTDAERKSDSVAIDSNAGIYTQAVEFYNKLASSFENIKEQIPQIVYPDETSNKDLNAFSEDVSKAKYQLFILPPFSYKSGTAKNSISKSKPSSFPESLMFQTLARFSSLKDSIEIVFTTTSQKSPTGKLPLILTPEGKALVGDELRDLLLYGPNRPDNEEKPSLELRSMLHLIESTLETTLLYFFFMDTDYFDRKTLSYLGAGLSWPVSWISAQITKQQTISSLLKRHSVLDKDLLLLDSSETLNALEHTLKSLQKDPQSGLSDSDSSNEIVYFSTTKNPDLLDAAVFAHFHIMTSAFPSKHPLQELAKEFPLLQEHSAKISREFFPKPSKK